MPVMIIILLDDLKIAFLMIIMIMIMLILGASPGTAESSSVFESSYAGGDYHNLDHLTMTPD